MESISNNLYQFDGIMATNIGCTSSVAGMCIYLPILEWQLIVPLLDGFPCVGWFSFILCLLVGCIYCIWHRY